MLVRSQGRGTFSLLEMQIGAAILEISTENPQ